MIEENSLAPMKIRVPIMKLKVQNPPSAIGGASPDKKLRAMFHFMHKHQIEEDAKLHAFCVR